jgi:hypothetical protein
MRWLLSERMKRMLLVGFPVLLIALLHIGYGLHPVHVQITLKHTLHNTLNGNQKDKSEFGLCVIGKDERDLPEWVEYHKRKGCSKFYIYDNDSEVKMSTYLKNYIDSGLVVYIPTTFNETLGDSSPITYAKNNCTRTYGHLHKWLGLLDADEFIVTENNKSIPEVLRDFEGYGGVALNWMMFGSSGLVESPGSILGPHYTKCVPNIHVKAIVNPMHVSLCRSSHYCNYYYPYFAVNVDKERVAQTHWSESHRIKTHTMYINHYVTKSLQDFRRKQKRGSGDYIPARSDQFFHEVDKTMTQDCPALLMPPDLNA